jgi:hypothetical protein
MRVPRVLVVSGTVAAVAGTLIVAASSTITTAAAPAKAVRPAATHRPSARFISEARAALVKYLHHNHGTALLVHPAQAGGPKSTTTESSYNWAGYEDVSSTAGTFTQVGGQWITPTVTCNKEDTITSEWVGLDGWSDGTVEQDGTLDWCFEDTATYFTWYEMYPAGTIEVGTSLQPGDNISASVTRSGTSYTLALTDSTHPANSFSESATCALTTCLDTSAEWIAERPEFSIGIAPLASYHTWTLTNGTQTSNGTAGTINSFPGAANRLKSNMIDATQSYDLSTAGALTGGNTFTTTFKDTY